MSETATKQVPDLVQLTDRAIAQVQALWHDELAKLQADDPTLSADQAGLRLGVQGGGCSGFSYKLAFGRRAEKDYVIPAEGFNVLLDPKSAIYLKGITLDYQGGLEGKGFVFQNPNAANTCGCGESFSV